MIELPVGAVDFIKAHGFKAWAGEWPGTCEPTTPTQRVVAGVFLGSCGWPWGLFYDTNTEAYIAIEMEVEHHLA